MSEDRILGREVNVPAHAERFVIHKDSSSDDGDDGFRQVRLSFRVGDYPVIIYVTTSIDGEEIEHQQALGAGHAQTLVVAANALSVAVDNLGSGVCLINYRVDTKVTPTSAWTTTTIGQGSVAPAELTIPPFAQEFMLRWLDAEDAPTVSFYDPSGTVVASRTLTPTEGWIPVHRSGVTKVTKTNNQYFTAAFRCLG